MYCSLWAFHSQPVQPTCQNMPCKHSHWIHFIVLLLNRFKLMSQRGLKSGRTPKEGVSSIQIYQLIYKYKTSNLVGIDFLLANRLMNKLCLLEHYIEWINRRSGSMLSGTWTSGRSPTAIEPSQHPWLVSSRPSPIMKITLALNSTPPLVKELAISGVDTIIHSGSFPIANPPYANAPWAKRGVKEWV